MENQDEQTEKQSPRVLLSSVHQHGCIDGPGRRGVRITAVFPGTLPPLRRPFLRPFRGKMAAGERLIQFVDRAVAVLRLLFQALHHNGFQIRRHIDVQ